MEDFGFSKITPFKSFFDIVKTPYQDINTNPFGSFSDFPGFNMPFGNTTAPMQTITTQKAPVAPKSGSTILREYLDSMAPEKEETVPTITKSTSLVSPVPTKSKAEFLKVYKPYADKIEKETGVDSTLILSVAGLESGFGTHSPGNNFFGIKGKDLSGKTQRLTTKEQGANGMYSTKDNFRVYDSPEESFRDFATLLLGNTRYSKVLKKKKYEAANALAEAGYATDSNYAGKLKTIMKSI